MSLLNCSKLNHSPFVLLCVYRDTVTEQGITSKHLLVATAQGAILDLPLHMVDPRRPALNTPAHLREPGIPPYIPELALPHENVMNYNQTLQGIRGTSMLILTRYFPR